jgi:hypothetical protein
MINTIQDDSELVDAHATSTVGLDALHQVLSSTMVTPTRKQYAS